MGKEKSAALKALDATARRAYSVIKDREAEVPSDDTLNGLTTPGVVDAVGQVISAVSGVSQTKGKPWFRFTVRVIEDGVGKGLLVLRSELFTVFHYVADSTNEEGHTFATAEENFHGFCNDLKLLGEKDTLETNKDIGQVDVAMDNIDHRKPYVLFKSGMRVLKKKKGEEKTPNLYKCQFLGLVPDDYDAPGTTLKVVPDETTDPGPADFAEGERCSAEYDGTLYDGVIQAIDHEQDIASVLFDDGDTQDVEVSDLQPSQG